MIEQLLSPAILGTLIPIVAIVTFGGVLVARTWFRHQERMAMIDAGMHPDQPALEHEDDEGRVELELPSAEHRSTPLPRSR